MTLIQLPLGSLFDATNAHRGATDPISPAAQRAWLRLPATSVNGLTRDDLWRAGLLAEVDTHQPAAVATLIERYQLHVTATLTPLPDTDIPAGHKRLSVDATTITVSTAVAAVLDQCRPKDSGKTTQYLPYAFGDAVETKADIDDEHASSTPLPVTDDPRPGIARDTVDAIADLITKNGASLHYVGPPPRHQTRWWNLAPRWLGTSNTTRAITSIADEEQA